MRSFFLGIAVIAGLAVTSSNAATLNFVAEANTNGERGIVDGTTLNIDGINVGFNTGGNNAYFDASSPAEVATGGAGLGVCSAGLTSTKQCNDSSDDNIQSGEAVTLSFDSAMTLSGLLFNADGHFALTNAFDTLLFGVNGGGLVAYNFAELMTKTFNNVTTATFAFGGKDGRQYYVSAASVTSAVPLPAGAPLLLAGLAMLGFGAKRGRKTKA